MSTLQVYVYINVNINIKVYFSYWLVHLCSHQSGEVAMASFYRMDSESSHLPSTLSALEEQNFLFQLQLSNQPQDDSNEVGRHSLPLCDTVLCGYSGHKIRIFSFAKILNI